MKALTIGDVVRVSAISEPGYNMDGHRRIRVTTCEPFIAAITGQKRVQLGEYKPAKLLFHGLEPDELARLKVTGTKLLWLVRNSLQNHEFMVDDEHLEVIFHDGHDKVPSRAKLPKFHQEVMI